MFFAKSENAFAFRNRSRERFENVWFTTIEGLISERQFSGNDHRDLLDLLLSLKDADTGEPLSKIEIRDQCATMLVAGSETTGRLMFWAIYLLTQDIEEQAKSRAEIAAFPPGRVRSLNDLQHWPRLRNVLLEALRLYPPAASIVREAIEADEVGGERIAAKTQVWFSAWIMHRHRKFWDQPTAFIPDRFCGQGGALDANSQLHSVRRWTAHLHWVFLRLVGSARGIGDAVGTLQNQPTCRKTCVADWAHYD